MKRFRRLRRRRAALALLPVAALLTISITAGAASGAGADPASFDANKARVKPGAKVKVRGNFPADPRTLAGREGETSADRRVRIEFKPAGKDHFRAAESTVSDARGDYRETVRVRRSGFYRAVHADGRISSPDRVRVKSRLRARVADKDVNLGDRVAIKGRVQPAIGSRRVVVSIGGDKLSTRTGRNGKFKLRWKAQKTGTFAAKVKARGDRVAAGSRDKAGRTTVYRPTHASYYGPGLYGNPVACGGTLTPSTVGVAHKTMPCGTKLTLRYRGRSVKVKVIDRGPYVAGREFDLTYATKQKLGFGSTGTVWSSK
jgi:hypothetical protein